LVKLIHRIAGVNEVRVAVGRANSIPSRIEHNPEAVILARDRGDVPGPTRENALPLERLDLPGLVVIVGIAAAMITPDRFEIVHVVVSIFEGRRAPIEIVGNTGHPVGVVAGHDFIVGVASERIMRAARDISVRIL
jgi:hypothetical protein